MVSNKYGELIEDTLKVKNDIDRRMHLTNAVDTGVMATIIVVSQHSREDLSYSHEVIGDESKTKITGQKIKEYRLSHGLTQEQLAKQLGISRPYMSEIESNKRSMRVKTIKNFTDKLGITLNDFFN